MWDMPEGLGFFQYLSGLEEPLRVSDVYRHLRELNMPRFLPSVLVKSLLVSPIRHQGVGVGTIYLGHDRDDREFTQEDEETLVMFASQAAMAIANASRHREERRARADLETLINTSPVGVGFSTPHGCPRILNLEAGGSSKTCATRPDGGGPLDLLTSAGGRTGLPAGVPHGRTAERWRTVRAEEIVLKAPVAAASRCCSTPPP